MRKIQLFLIKDLYYWFSSAALLMISIWTLASICPDTHNSTYKYFKSRSQIISLAIGNDCQSRYRTGHFKIFSYKYGLCRYSSLLLLAGTCGVALSSSNMDARCLESFWTGVWVILLVRGWIPNITYEASMSFSLNHYIRTCFNRN